MSIGAIDSKEVAAQRFSAKTKAMLTLGAVLGVIGVVALAGTPVSETSSGLLSTRNLKEEIAQANDNGSGRWGGKITIVDNLPQVCQYEAKSVTWFSANGQGNLAKGESVTIGPFGGYYTLGVQENVFGNCAYAGSCAWNNHSADNYCYNFNVDSNCKVTRNDCPYPAGVNGGPSPAPDGRKRYTITGSINNGVCVLTVNPVSPPGPFFCSATLG